MLGIKTVFLVIVFTGTGGEEVEVSTVTKSLADCNDQLKSLLIATNKYIDDPENDKIVTVKYGCKEVKPKKRKIQVGYSF